MSGGVGDIALPEKEHITALLKDYAIHQAGFDKIAICRAEPVSRDMEFAFSQWLANGFNGEMRYMENYYDKRCNPVLLCEHAKSVICVALNYYPPTKQDASYPQFAYYAYGKDYHLVVKEKLKQIVSFLNSLYPNLKARVFCDTAPLLERYWAEQSGLGFIGKNSMLIIPSEGSFFFLGEILVDAELIYDQKRSKSRCGNCSRCMSACPTKAIVAPKIVDATKCISYQTIENKSMSIDEAVLPHLDQMVYGCDICQKSCPWNRFSKACQTADFYPSAEFLSLSADKLLAMSKDDFNRIFSESAVNRTNFNGLRRNMALVKKEE